MNTWLGVWLVMLVLVVAACGGGAAPTATPADEDATEEDAGASEGEVLVGDDGAGEALFDEMQSAVGYACSTCHRVDSTEMLVGPGLLGIAARAATRVEGLSAAAYLEQSIMAPGAHTVEGFEAQAELMPRQYPELFSAEQISDLVAYLLTLEEE